MILLHSFAGHKHYNLKTPNRLLPKVWHTYTLIYLSMKHRLTFGNGYYKENKLFLYYKESKLWWQYTPVISLFDVVVNANSLVPLL